MSFAKRQLEELEERYYRKYKCPECDEYHLHISGDSFAECPEGYQTSDVSVISDIIESEDYDGMFSEEDLQSQFY